MDLKAMLTAHWFWGLLTLAVLAWYSTITVYVSIKGVLDIEHMLARLSALAAEEAKEKEKADS
jgi:hypothetical protein